jgi:hypothetical protein
VFWSRHVKKRSSPLKTAKNPFARCFEACFGPDPSKNAAPPLKLPKIHLHGVLSVFWSRPVKKRSSPLKTAKNPFAVCFEACFGPDTSKHEANKNPRFTPQNSVFGLSFERFFEPPGRWGICLDK